MNIKSFNCIAGNNRQLYKKTLELIEKHNFVIFEKEGVHISSDDIYWFNLFADFEAKATLDRQKTGRAKAVANGVKMGAPCFSSDKIEEIKRRKARGDKAKDISIKMNISLASVYKYIKEE